MKLNKNFIDKNIRAVSFEAVDKNLEERTIDFCASTGAKVTRHRWFSEPVYEELEISEKSVDLTRLDNGAPLLKDHDASTINNQLGVIEKSWIKNNRLFVRARFSKRADVEPIYQDILDKIIRNVSIGYVINSYEKYKGDSDTYETIRATNFTPHEVSFVTIPFDFKAGVRSLDDDYIPMCLMEEIEEMKRIRSNIVLSSEPEKTPDQNLDKDKIASNEQERILTIINYCSKRNINGEEQQKIIKETKTLDEAKLRIADIILQENKELEAKRSIDNKFNQFENENKNQRHSPITGTEHDEKMLSRKGIENALEFRTNVDPELNDNGRRFINLSMLEMCRKLVHGSEYLSTGDLFKRVVTTTDLPNILLNITGKSVRQKYKDMQQTFRPLISEREVTNLKLQTELQTGTFQALPDVAENEQFVEATFSESKETYRVTKHGLISSVTEEMIINDDLSIINRMPGMFARAAAEKENILVWRQLTDSINCLMADGKPVFHKDRGNISKNPRLLDSSCITEGLLAIKGQKGLDDEDLFYDSDVKYLITTTANKERAMRLLTPFSATKAEDINIYAGKFELIIEDKISVLGKMPFILACSPEAIDGLILAYLKGNKGVTVGRHEEWRTNSIAFDCKLFAAAKVLDHRGFFLNPGA